MRMIIKTVVIQMKTLIHILFQPMQWSTIKVSGSRFSVVYFYRLITYFIAFKIIVLNVMASYEG